MVQATRQVVLRDFVIFQVKLVLDGLKDVALSALSVGALVLDIFSGGGRRPRLFYAVLAMSERFDLWLNLSGAVSRLESDELDEDGLFGASEAGSDSLLGKVEEMVRGREIPPELKREMSERFGDVPAWWDDERPSGGGAPHDGPTDPVSPRPGSTAPRDGKDPPGRRRS